MFLVVAGSSNLVVQETTLAEEPVPKPKLESLPDWESLPEIELQNVPRVKEPPLKEPFINEPTLNEALDAPAIELAKSYQWLKGFADFYSPLIYDQILTLPLQDDTIT
jgi:hypothetical protein